MKIKDLVGASFCQDATKEENKKKRRHRRFEL